MTILAILQNMWFKDPDAAKRIFDRYPEKRNYLISQFLFMGCTTGRRLRQAFGELCDEIIWEEAHPDLGGNSGSKFGFDASHIEQSIRTHTPDIILAFGKIASDGLLAAMTRISMSEHPLRCYVIWGPHPAARQKDILTQLHATAERLRSQLLKAQYSNSQQKHIEPALTETWPTGRTP